MASSKQLNHQRCIIAATQAGVAQLLETLTRLVARSASYARLCFSDDSILDEATFQGVGADRAAYRGAIVSIEAIKTLLATGHGTNMERFAR